MKKILLLNLLIICCGLKNLKSQVTISGPTCVLVGETYQYTINGTIDSTAQICISGGLINGNDSCTSNLVSALITIIWSGNSGSISFSSSSGNASQNISVIPALDPGSLDTTSKTQHISYNGMPNDIMCSIAAGGNCSPTYTYQWQQSLDDLDWTDISGSTNQNLSFSSGLIQTMFYRRKVIENGSNSIMYSEAGVIYVDPDYTGHQ